MRLTITVLLAWISIHKRALLVGSLLGMLLCSAAHAQAASVTVTWTNPSTNADGSALASTAITGTRVEYGSCSGTAFGVKSSETITTGAVTSTVFTLGPGTYCFRAYTRSAAGESAASNVASKTIVAPVPSPPTLVTIAVAAYDVRLEGNTYVAWRQVGTLPTGSPCYADVPTASGFGTVDVRAVALSKTPKSAVLVARCG